MFYKYFNINIEKIKILSNKFQIVQNFRLSNILLNFPILSTTHASCCGTNKIIVLIGVLERQRTGAFCGIDAENCSCPKTDIAWNEKKILSLDRIMYA